MVRRTGCFKKRDPKKLLNSYGMCALLVLLFYTCKVKLGSGLLSTRHGLFPFFQTISVLRNGNEVLVES